VTGTKAEVRAKSGMKSGDDALRRRSISEEAGMKSDKAQSRAKVVAKAQSGGNIV
jgi:hypothetical protein